MTIYTRKYPDFGGMTSVLILTYLDTGMLSGCLLDYTKDGRLTGIHPHERISAMELERNWTMMLPDTKTWPCLNCGKPLYDSGDHGIIHVNQSDQCSISRGCEHMGDGRVCGGCMGATQVGW